MKIRGERFSKVRHELMPLWYKQWDEVAHNNEYMKFNPDWKAYCALEEIDMLWLITVRNDEGAVVGYMTMLIAPYLHSKEWVIATEDALYLLPEYRKGFTFIKLLKYAEEMSKAKGAVTFDVSTSKYDFGHILERRGYDKKEVKWSKQLYNKSERQSWQQV